MASDVATAPDMVPDGDETPAKGSKMPLIIGLVMLLVGGGGGFYATWSGMILGAELPKEEMVKEDTHEAPKTAFVSVDPIVISLSGLARAKHLHFRAELEVPEAYKEDVQAVLPRVVDVLNSYLRAIEPRDLEDRSALTRLRAQMLRRVQIVAGQEKVNDLLVMEFVLN